MLSVHISSARLKEYDEKRLIKFNFCMNTKQYYPYIKNNNKNS